MSDLSELSDRVGRSKFKSGTYTNADVLPPRNPVDVLHETFIPQGPTQFNPKANPGDPDFDWRYYDDWKRNYKDPVAEAMPQVEAARRDEEEATHNAQEEKFEEGKIPTTFMGGATRHLLEDEPAARNAMLSGAALLTPLLVPEAAAGAAGTAAMAAVPFVGKAAEIGSRVSHGDYTGKFTPGDVIESFLNVATPPAVEKAVDVVRGGKNLVASILPNWLRRAGSLTPKGAVADALTSEPVLQGAEQAAKTLRPTGFVESLKNIIRGLKPGVEEADAAPSSWQKWRQAKTSPEYTPAPESPVISTDEYVRSYKPNPNQVGMHGPNTAPAEGGPNFDDVISAMEKQLGAPEVLHPGSGPTIDLPMGTRVPPSKIPTSKALPRDVENLPQILQEEAEAVPEAANWNGATTPYPPPPGHVGFGRQKVRDGVKMLSQDSLLDLVNALAEESGSPARITNLKTFPKPTGQSPTARAIRQRAHAFGGK